MFPSHASTPLRNALFLLITDIVNHARDSSALQWAWEKFNSIDISDLLEPISTTGSGLMERFEPQINQLKVMWTKLETRPETKYIKAYVIRTFKKVRIVK